MTTPNHEDIEFEDIDFSKQKRGKGKNKPDPKRWSFFLIEGIIVLVAIVAGGRFLFSDNTDVSDLQATIDAQSSQPALSVDALLQRALEEKANGEVSEAIRSLDLLLELDSTHADAYYERAELYFDNKQYYEATKDYERALEYNNDPSIRTYFKLGRSRFERADYEGAIQAFDRVIELSSLHTNAYYWRGRSYAEAGDYRSGIDDMLYAVEREYSELAFAYFFIAEAYDNLEDYDKALAYYTLSIEHAEDDCETYYCWIDYNNRGVTHYSLGDYDSAIVDYTSAIQMNPDEYPLAMKNRGDAYNEIGETTLAFGDWNTMFQLLENKVVSRAFLADSNVLTDKLDEADAQVHVEFDGTSGDVITITLDVPADSHLNAMLILRDVNGSPFAFTAPPDDVSAQLSDITLPETGTYTVVVASHLARTSGEFKLQLE